MICGAKVEPDETEPLGAGREQAAPPAPAEEPAPAVAEPVAGPPPVQIAAGGAAATPARPQGRSKAPLFVALGVALVLGGAFAVWRFAGPKPNTGPVPGEPPVRQPSASTPKPDAKAEKPNPPADKPAESGAATIAALRTEVTKALANVSAAGWSDASCKKELAAIASLSKKAQALGRQDLAAYWQSLSFYVQACNAGTHQDLAKAKANFEKAAAALLKIPVGQLSADPTLKGDAIGTIGSYLSLANDIGLPDGYPPVKGLRQLKRKLEQ